METSFTMEWKGDLVERKTREACAWGIDSVMADCVTTAMGEHPWKNRTTVLQGSHKMQPAKDQGTAIVGIWGSWAVVYARWLEEGTRRMRPYSWLVPAANRHYPSLGLRIRAKLAWA